MLCRRYRPSKLLKFEEWRPTTGDFRVPIAHKPAVPNTLDKDIIAAASLDIFEAQSGFNLRLIKNVR
jgi:hypothetical protein